MMKKHLLIRDEGKTREQEYKLMTRYNVKKIASKFEIHTDALNVLKAEVNKQEHP